MASRQIVFIRLSGFYLAASGITGDQRHEALFAVISDGHVVEASDAATMWGVYSGISEHLAKQRCPNLLFTESNPERCAELYDRVWRIIAELTEFVEPTGLHQGFLDLTMDIPREKSLDELMRTLGWRMKFEFGLQLQWAGGRDRWLAQVACGENKFIEPDEESAYLKCCPLKHLRLPVEMIDRLLRFGIKTVADLISTPASFLQSHLGISYDFLMPYLLRGDSTVRISFPPPVLSIAEDVDGWCEEDIQRALHTISNNAATLLHSKHLQCSAIAAQLFSRGASVSQTLKLSKATYSASVLLRLLTYLWQSQNGVELTRIELELRDLLPAPQTQGDLWQSTMNSMQKVERLEKLKAQVEQKFGYQSLLTADQYALQIPPRFAQLVYACRGMPLP